MNEKSFLAIILESRSARVSLWQDGQTTMMRVPCPGSDLIS